MKSLETQTRFAFAFQEDQLGDEGEITKTKEPANCSSRPPPIIVIDDEPLLVVTPASTPNSPVLVRSDKTRSYAEPTAQKVMQVNKFSF